MEQIDSSARADGSGMAVAVRLKAENVPAALVAVVPEVFTAKPTPPMVGFAVKVWPSPNSVPSK